MTNGRSQSVFGGSISNTLAPKFLRKLRTSRCCSEERDRKGFGCGLMVVPDCAFPGAGIVHGDARHHCALKYQPTTAPQNCSGCYNDRPGEARAYRNLVLDHPLPWPCVHPAVLNQNTAD